MTSTHPGARRAAVAVAAALAMAVSLLQPAAAHAEQAPAAQDADADQDARAQTLQAGSGTECFADPSGDTLNEDTDEAEAFPRADLVEHCVSFEKGLTVSAEVADPTNPSSDPNWEQATFVGWFLDVDDDDRGDFFVDFSLNRDGALGARVLDVRGDEDDPGNAPVVCEQVLASFDGRTYTAGPFSTECLDGATSAAVSAGTSYDLGGPDGPRYSDAAPGAGDFSEALARDADACGSLPAGFADRDEVAEVHRPGVDCLFARGITIGVLQEGRRFFVPRSNISRGQFAAFVARTFADVGVALPDPQRPRFGDVGEDHTFDEPIHQLAEAGILRGKTSQRFAPEESIRRDQTGSVLARAFAFAQGLEDRSPDNPGAYFRDTADNVHSDNIDFAFEEGLVKGVEAPSEAGPGRYAPDLPTQRQQKATVLHRFLTIVESD